MDFFNILSNNFIIIVLALLVISGVIMSIISSLTKKGVDVALDSSKGALSGISSSIAFIFFIIKEIFAILFLFLSLIFNFMLKKR